VRVLDRLDQLYAIGGGPGANRVGYSPEEDEAHALTRLWLEEAGLETHVDDAGNLLIADLSTSRVVVLDPQGAFLCEWTLDNGPMQNPTEFSASRQPLMPSSSSSVASISSTSASRSAESDPDHGGPSTSAPICQNWRYRPRCGRSRRNCGPM